MKKYIILYFLIVKSLYASSSYSDKIIADIEKEIEATIYLLDHGETNFIKEDLVEDYSLGPIDDYKIEEYLSQNTNNKTKIEIIKNINKYMKIFFPLEKEIYIKKIVLAIIKVESSYRKNAIGDLNTNSPAYGLMQVRLSTAKYMQKKIEIFKKDKKMNETQLSNYLRTIEGGIKYGMGYLYFKKKYNDYNKINNKDKFFTMISLYNGGKLNHKYVNKVFKVINEMDRI